MFREKYQQIQLLIDKKCALKEIGSKVGCFPGFCHHCLMTMSVYMHVCHYPCLKVEQKWVCEQSLYAGKIECYIHKHKEQQ